MIMSRTISSHSLVKAVALQKKVHTCLNDGGSLSGVSNGRKMNFNMLSNQYQA